ncbi:MAG TPA: SDR family oxidoreductase [Rhodothermales bacterium]|nr:SDR family oxidoreductase [Rhodothermales bacterium]
MKDGQSTPETVVITGASAGVGRATARLFAQHGAHVGLLARGNERLEATKKEVEDLGGQALAIPTDVAFADQVEAAAEQVEQAFGPIDVWVNNAMTSVFAQFTEITPEEYRRVTDVVYHGQVYGTMSALKRMLPRNHGSIVLVGSALAYRGIPLQSAYCGGKHAIEGMFDSIRTELLHNESAVRITMVQMPALNTPQFDWVLSKLPHKAQPVPPIFQPEVAADAIYYAAHHHQREILVGFPTVKAVLGNKLVPVYADHYLAEHGFKSQQTSEPEDSNRPSNLWESVPGDYEAHGRFDSRARTFSPELWAAKNKHWLTLAGAGIASFAATLIASRH